MQSIIGRFWGFDRLIGPVLVKILYYTAAAGIIIMVGITMLMGFLAVFAGNMGGGLMQLVAAPAVGAVALVYWRFLCELFMLAFLTYERLGEVRDALAPPLSAPDPNHPAF
jgi:hypothetical protein